METLRGNFLNVSAPLKFEKILLLFNGIVHCKRLVETLREQKIPFEISTTLEFCMYGYQQ
jgi:hypothetical protein